MTITSFKDQLKRNAKDQILDLLLVNLFVDASSGVVKEDVSFDIDTNLLLFKEQIYVPDNPILKLNIFRSTTTPLLQGILAKTRRTLQSHMNTTGLEC